MNFWKHPLVRQIAGWALIALGILGLILPGLPGWVFLGAGALLLAPYVRVFRRLAAWLRVRFPALRGYLRPFRDLKGTPPPPES